MNFHVYQCLIALACFVFVIAFGARPEKAAQWIGLGLAIFMISFLVRW